ncbi:hypothetical protein MLD52_19990 [Puniceicoccaceae bacterium K14]|nr:hypothetical protein [Puniceicoccaceae bacterium K14]
MTQQLVVEKMISKLRPFTLAALGSILIFLSGCTYGIVRKEWKPIVDRHPLPTESEFISVMEAINQEFNLELQDRWIDYEGKPFPLWYTRDTDETTIPPWLNITYDMPDRSVILWFIIGFNKEKNKDLIDQTGNKIEKIVEATLGINHEIQILYDDNYRMPSDII